MQICIIEDNPSDVQQIISSLKNISDHFEFPINSLVFNDPDQICYDINPDCYLVDINLPHTSGFEICSKITSSDPHAIVIFCSAHEEFVFSSFDFSPFYFIRKSHLQQDLTKAMLKLIDYTKNHSWYFIDEKKNSVCLNYLDIVYFESCGNNTLILCKDGRLFQQRISLRKVEQTINMHYFMRVSRAFLLNIDTIDSFHDDSIVLKIKDTHGKPLRIAIPQSQKQKLIDAYSRSLAR